MGGAVTDGRGLGDLDYCYLTTTGRHTGSPHQIEIWFAISDAHVYLLSGAGDHADWVRNLMVSPEVVVEIGDLKRTTKARVVSDPVEDAKRFHVTEKGRVLVVPEMLGQKVHHTR